MLLRENKGQPMNYFIKTIRKRRLRSIVPTKQEKITY